MKHVLLLLITIVYFPTSNIEKSKHPIHVSVTNADWNSSKNIDITIKLFTDDFEKIINHNYNTKLLLGTENENKNSELFITKYVNSHLKFIFNNNSLNTEDLILINKKHIDQNVTWLYLSLKVGYKPKSVAITNSLMTDLYNDQDNLFIYTCELQQKAIKFDNSKISDEF